MLESFREIYDRELEFYENRLEKLILSSQDVRMFVYQVCKACLSFQQGVEADAKIRMECAFLDETCVDCEEDCPAAGGAG
ncbi:MAG: hypothetical protein JRI41_06060 [Deltaproteobacteria bacterium]|nr:hypothetical protein [Deltaproteobacteria bacterium]